jgi:hypothetical protein
MIREKELVHGVHSPIGAMTAHAKRGMRSVVLPPEWMPIFPNR